MASVIPCAKRPRQAAGDVPIFLRKWCRIVSREPNPQASAISDNDNLPHGKMTASKLEAWPQDTLFVVYCAGPHCNGTDRAALRLARLGRRVKVMIGGLIGWEDEGLPFAAGEAPGSVNAEAVMPA
jgi:rhodanese-related sulfurtransferase